MLSKQDLVRDSFRLWGFPSQYDSEVGKLAMKIAYNQRGPTHEVAVFPREVEHESIHCVKIFMGGHLRLQRAQTRKKYILQARDTGICSSVG